nr:DUF2194 domain-containing protein [Eubacterium sp.]
MAMVTKRKFLTMAVMMFVLLFMFQFTQVMKEAGNEYDTNEYAGTSELNKNDVWEDSGNNSAVLIGTEESLLGNVAKQWCTYTKRSFHVYETLVECPSETLKEADAILIDPSHIEYERQMSLLTLRVEQGADVVFLSLPESDMIKENEQLQKLLGIDEVKAEQVQLEGINLFTGFLLGGQTIYKPKDEKEKQERQDLDLQIPWYVTGNASKTYMVGMMSDTSVKNEQLPAIIWRNSLGTGNVFAVNGDYMSELTGIGILDAMMAECNEYDVYPVVNAQSLAVANFPGLAAENEEEMNRLYSRDQVAVYRDILWPSLYSTVEKSGSQLTCYLAPQFDYTDGNEPQVDQLVFYLKQLKEKGAEAGLSMEYVKGSGLADKLTRDDAFFESAGSDYEYGSVYMPEVDTEVIETWRRISRYEGLDTIISQPVEEEPILSYVNECMTRQFVTSSGISHTFSEDLRMKSIQTSLGYSNIVLDMNQISWPKKESDRWEIVSEQFSSNINTYWKPFEMFAQTTASESDERIRGFLAMDYEDSREDNVIQIQVEKKTNQVWMVLRTHGEDIEAITGGEFVEIEDDAYLLCIQDDICRVTTKSKDQLKYPLPEK